MATCADPNGKVMISNRICLILAMCRRTRETVDEECLSSMNHDPIVMPNTHKMLLYLHNICTYIRNFVEEVVDHNKIIVPPCLTNIPPTNTNSGSSYAMFVDIVYCHFISHGWRRRPWNILDMPLLFYDAFYWHSSLHSFLGRHISRPWWRCLALLSWRTRRKIRGSGPLNALNKNKMCS